MGIAGYKPAAIKFTALPALAQRWRDQRRTPPSAFPRPAHMTVADLARRIEEARERAYPSREAVAINETIRAFTERRYANLQSLGICVQPRQPRGYVPVSALAAPRENRRLRRNGRHRA